MVVTTECEKINYEKIKNDLKVQTVKDNNKDFVVNIFYNTSQMSKSFKMFTKLKKELLSKYKYINIYLIKNKITFFIGKLECNEIIISNILTLLSIENEYKTLDLKMVESFIFSNGIKNYYILY